MFVLSLKVILAFAEKSVNSSDGMFAKDSWSGEESKILSFVVLRQDENQYKRKKTLYTGFSDGSSGCSVCRLRNNPLCS